MFSFSNLGFDDWEDMEKAFPTAKAELKGSAEHPEIEGEVWLYQTEEGVLVVAEVENLPGKSPYGGVFGFHIHEGESCGGDAFAETKEHYNPKGTIHPYHAGDLPPLFGNGEDGDAWMAVLTDRFTLDEVLGKTVVIHNKQDDFTTQPSGNSGRKIACGVIQKKGRRA